MLAVISLTLFSLTPLFLPLISIKFLFFGLCVTPPLMASGGPCSGRQLLWSHKTGVHNFICMGSKCFDVVSFVT